MENIKTNMDIPVKQNQSKYIFKGSQKLVGLHSH